MITACTLVYFVSEIRAGFVDIGQGTFYGVAFKFLFMNLAFMTYPAPTLYFIYRQIDYLTRRAGPRRGESTPLSREHAESPTPIPSK